MSYNTWLRSGSLTEWTGDARQDTAYAWRGLRRSPAFTLAILVVLALGLGANAAVFSVLDRIFLRLPTGIDAPREIRRLYYVRSQLPLALRPANGINDVVDYPEYEAIGAAMEHEAQVAAYVRPDSAEMRIGSAMVPAMVSYVTRSYFTTLRIRPSLGRFFTLDEDRVDVSSRAAVISDALWHRAFDGDPAVLGKQVRIADRTYSVVGVAPPGFDGIDLDRVDLWLPLGSLPPPPFWGPRPWYMGGLHLMRMIARVPPGISERRMGAAASAAYRHAQDDGRVRDTTSTVVTGPIVAALGPMDRPQEMSISLRLAGPSLILLCIAVGNVANLLLIRGMRRRREIAVRRAIGISTARLCRMLITESLLLTMLGAAAAVIIGTWGAMALRADSM